MVFVCRICGECCSTMGEIISIREKTGDSEFRIRYTTGEERDVCLDPDKKDFFFTKATPNTMACPFLREERQGRSLCTVHHSRPDLCRQYSCFRILVLDAQGNRVGRVLDKTRYFSATDPRLHEIWNAQCKVLDIEQDFQWEDEVGKVFTRAGYFVVK
jgi:Fe-S-cluster containining protein